MIDWIQHNDALLWWTAAASIVTFVGSLVGLPWLVVRIPRDYFVPGAPHRIPWANRHPTVRALLVVVKNVLGVLFVAVGLVMLVLPGQGLLTILVGVVLLDFPGKLGLLRWLVAQPPLLRSLNWLRRRSGEPPLAVDGGPRAGVPAAPDPVE